MASNGRLAVCGSSFLADRARLEAVGYVADSGRAKISFKQKAREYTALLLAVFDTYIFDTRPKFMGKKTPLKGDGRKTWNKNN